MEQIEFALYLHLLAGENKRGVNKINKTQFVTIQSIVWS
jgi:hypothetical protein